VTGILLSFILALQGIPVQQGGTVSGVLRDSRGMPLAGVRMAAVARGDVIENAAAASMAGITETDEQGRFTLENIPPGRYVIAAGRLDLQTYYPGTQELSDATVLTISREATIADINFVLKDTSFGRASNSPGTLFLSSLPLYSAAGLALQPVAAMIPVTVRVENGGKLPVTANGKEVSMTLSSASDRFTYPIEAPAISIPGPLSGSFSVRVDGLPPTHKVKAITYGTTDITNSTFPLSLANFSQASPGTILVNGTSITVMFAGPGPIATVPPSPLSIALEYVPPPKSPGVRVAGTVATRDRPNVYISGVPGIVFSDGTFEFRGVPPGRHLIAGMHQFTPQATIVVVGDREIDGVELRRTLDQPDTSVPQTIAPAGPYTPGTVLPLPRILGRVVDEETGKPIVDGSVTVENENYRRVFSLDSSGRFESFGLAPGNYDISLWLIGHVARTIRVAVEDKDVPVKLIPSFEN